MATSEATPDEARVSLEAPEGWRRVLDEHGTIELRADWPAARLPPVFRVRYVEDPTLDLAAVAAAVVADLRVVLSDCAVIDVAELSDGPFGGDVVHVVLAFRSGLVSQTFFYWLCGATDGYVNASLLCESEDAPIMSRVGSVLLESVVLTGAE